MSTPIVAGIDPSLACTAIAVWTPQSIRVKTIATKNHGSTVSDRIKRLEFIAATTMKFLRHYGANRIYIEGYAFASNKAGHSAIVELGGILRWHLVDLGPVAEVPPTTLKKFATGKGNGPKDMVAAHLTKRYGVLFDENNSYDAYGLARLGMVAEGIDKAANTAQQEAADVAKKSLSLEK